MKPVLFSLVLLIISTTGICSNECSVKKLNDFINCMSKKIHQQSSDWNVTYVKAIEKDVSICFTK